jgi:hypothetical protein
MVLEAILHISFGRILFDMSPSPCEVFVRATEKGYAHLSATPLFVLLQEEAVASLRTLTICRDFKPLLAKSEKWSLILQRERVFVKSLREVFSPVYSLHQRILIFGIIGPIAHPGEILRCVQDDNYSNNKN